MKKEIKKFLEENNISEKQFLGKEKIGGSLYLSSLTSIPRGFNPTVGGDLYTKNSNKRIGLRVEPIKINKNFFWKKEGKCYAMIDGIFCEILNERQRIIKGKKYRIFSAKKVNRDEYFYIANKGKIYAHAEDLKKAFEDLEFKIVSEKLKKQPIYKDTLITINHYRLLTGACELGCKNWMEQNNITKEKIKASELLILLEKTNAYGLEKFRSLLK